MLSSYFNGFTACLDITKKIYRLHGEFFATSYMMDFSSDGLAGHDSAGGGSLALGGKTVPGRGGSIQLNGASGKAKNQLKTIVTVWLLKPPHHRPEGQSEYLQQLARTHARAIC